MPCDSDPNPMSWESSRPNLGRFERIGDRCAGDRGPLGSFHTSDCRGGVQRRQMELKGVDGGD
eukprot:31439-Pelagococcus_subviridis.AAC.22